MGIHTEAVGLLSIESQGEGTEVGLFIGGRCVPGLAKVIPAVSKNKF